MSLYEMRIDRFSFDLTADYSQYNSFSIGHESCIIKFLKIIQNIEFIDFLQEQKNHGKEIRILTPFVPQQYLENIKKILSDILTKPLFQESMIIINDLGMMQYIHQKDPKRKLCLGRTLTFSFDFTPWGELIYKNESENVREVIKQVNLFDDIKLDFFKGYNVTAIESNITDNTVNSLIKINDSGLTVYINESYFLYGIQRSCPIFRSSLHNQCDCQKCDIPVRITLAKQWEDCQSFLNETIKYFPSVLFLRGNQICGKKRFHSEHPFNHIFSE